MLRRYYEKFYYTLGDILNETPYTTGNTTLKSLLDSYALVNDLASSSEPAEDLWSLMYGRYLNDFAIIKDEEVSPTSDEVKYFLIKLLNIYNMTNQRYKVLLKAYKDNLNDMLAKIETSSNGSNRYNDTPQGSGLYSDDTHTTSITENSNTTTTDGGSKMERIKELQDYYDNTLLRWCNEFASLFINDSEVEDF